MTAAKPHHLRARRLLLDHLDLHPGRTVGDDLDPLEAGIIGDTQHAEGGDSYHLGKDKIRDRAGRDRYSVDESARDRNGLDEYASAMDIGYFKVNTRRGTYDLYDFNIWLIELCRSGDPDTRDLREVIFSLDGKTVRRWDRLGRRSTGDSSHLTHTHLSEHRDADGHRMVRLATRWLQHIGLIDEEDDMTPEQARQLTEVHSTLKSLKVPTPAEIWLYQMGDPEKPPKDGKPQTSSAGSFLRYLPKRVGELGAALSAAITAAARGDDEALARIQAQLARLPEATADEVLDSLGALDTAQAKADLLRAVLGDDAAEVGWLLTGQTPA